MELQIGVFSDNDESMTFDHRISVKHIGKRFLICQGYVVNIVLGDFFNHFPANLFLGFRITIITVVILVVILLPPPTWPNWDP